MGDKNRITHEFGDGTLEKIMGDIDHGRIQKGNNWFFNHPAYYGTSIQQKAPTINICQRCAYFRKKETAMKKQCCFPWDKPKDYDTVIKEFLPCKGRRENAKNRERTY